MPWRVLGTLSPGYDWDLFDEVIIGGTLFRVTQTWNNEWPGIGHATISFYYPTRGRHGFYKVYANRDPLLMELPIPEAFEQAFLYMRDAQLKLGLRTRLYEGADWRIKLELWEPTASPQADDLQVIDGGSYDGTPI